MEDKVLGQNSWVH